MLPNVPVWVGGFSWVHYLSKLTPIWQGDNQPVFDFATLQVELVFAFLVCLCFCFVFLVAGNVLAGMRTPKLTSWVDESKVMFATTVVCRTKHKVQKTTFEVGPVWSPPKLPVNFQPMLGPQHFWALDFEGRCEDWMPTPCSFRMKIVVTARASP